MKVWREADRFVTPGHGQVTCGAARHGPAAATCHGEEAKVRRGAGWKRRKERERGEEAVRQEGRKGGSSIPCPRRWVTTGHDTRPGGQRGHPGGCAS